MVYDFSEKKYITKLDTSKSLLFIKLLQVLKKKNPSFTWVKFKKKNSLLWKVNVDTWTSFQNYIQAREH